MKLRYIQFACVIFWGIQADLLWFAIPMGLIWEGQFFLNRRWELTQQDFYRVADLTSVVLVGVVIFLFLNRTDYHFVTTLVLWLPIVFFPLVTVINYSTREFMSLDVMFYSLRRQKQPVTQSWDLDYLFFGMCLIAAGTNREIGSFYFPIAALLLSLCLFPLRSKRYQFTTWFLAIAIVFLLGFATQQSIRGTHLELKRRTAAWIANWIQQRTNPLKIQTSIGSVGELKLSNEILFRLRVPPDKAAPKLFQEASYNLPTGSSSWTIMDPTFTTIDHKDDFQWQVNEISDEDVAATVYLEFGRKKALVPLPHGTTEVSDLPALDIKQNRYGTVQGVGLVRSPKYNIRYRPGDNLNGLPELTDTFIPPQYESLLERAGVEKVLDSDQPIRSIANFFEGYKYSLYQDIEGADKAFENFLLTSKAGHCEYYAGASVLLLRKMGIPARYVIGYSVQEYSELLDMYLVRRRHGHAWAIAYIDEKWQVVDSTPTIWLEREASQESLIQPIIDLVKNGNFLFQTWWNDQKIEDYEIHLYVIGAILTLILFWRIMTSEQVVLKKNEEIENDENLATEGSNSPFYKIELKLVEAGFRRGSGELLKPWLERVGFSELVKLLPFHDRWRFDPLGISIEDQKALNDQVNDQLQKFEENPQLTDTNNY